MSTIAAFVQPNGNASPVSADTPLPTDPLGMPTVARQLAATATSASVQVSPFCRRLSIRASVAGIRYAVGETSATATHTSHFIAHDERLDINVPAGGFIAAMRNGATDGTLEISELV